jgi:hypothetical protein
MVNLGKQVRKIYKYDELYVANWSLLTLFRTGTLVHAGNNLRESKVNKWRHRGNNGEKWASVGK